MGVGIEPHDLIAGPNPQWKLLSSQGVSSTLHSEPVSQFTGFGVKVYDARSRVYCSCDRFFCFGSCLVLTMSGFGIPINSGLQGSGLR